ncbi:MAG: hypothetical protein PHE53_11590 [Thermoguttaceae bacterium]|nr:hypothetical protein [Thermoguttaceae bacterium]
MRYYDVDEWDSMIHIRIRRFRDYFPPERLGEIAVLAAIEAVKTFKPKFRKDWLGWWVVKRIDAAVLAECERLKIELPPRLSEIDRESISSPAEAPYVDCPYVYWDHFRQSLSPQEDSVFTDLSKVYGLYASA